MEGGTLAQLNKNRSFVEDLSIDSMEISNVEASNLKNANSLNLKVNNSYSSFDENETNLEHKNLFAS